MFSFVGGGRAARRLPGLLADLQQQGRDETQGIRNTEAIGYAGRLRQLRAETGRDEDPAVVVALNDALHPEDFAKAEAGGVTEVMTMPWMYYFGFDATLAQKIEGMERFAKDVVSVVG